jgi:hypothetical protein
MWGGEPVKKDPEAAVVAAAAGGGDEVRSGSALGVPRQSAAEEGRMMPREAEVKVETVAGIVHYVDVRTEKYRTTEIDIKATATITYSLATIKIQEGRYVRNELYDLDLEYLEKLINEARKEVANKAAKFINKRNELCELFEKLGIRVEFERVEKGGDR